MSTRSGGVTAAVLALCLFAGIGLFAVALWLLNLTGVC